MINELRYHLKCGGNFDKYAANLTRERLEILIDHGFSAEHITDEFYANFSSNDRDCYEHLITMVKADRFVRFMYRCSKHGFHDIVRANLHRVEKINDYDLFKAYLDETEDDNDVVKCFRIVLFNADFNPSTATLWLVTIAFSFDNYNVIDKINEVNSDLIKRVINEIGSISFEKIPAHYGELLKSSLIPRYWDKICQAGRSDIAEIVIKNHPTYASYPLIYEYVNLDIYRILRAKNNILSYEYYFVIRAIGDAVYDDLFSDENFIKSIDKFYLRFIVSAELAGAFKILNRLLSTQCTIDGITDTVVNHFHRNMNNDSDFIARNCTDITMNATGKVAIRSGLLETMLVTQELPLQMYNKIIEIADCTALSFEKIELFDEVHQPIFRWQHRKGGIKEYAVRLLTLMVLHSDGYIRAIPSIEHFEVYAFFKFVKKLPFTIQSIIAHRYAWLPNCEPILLQDINFLRELAIYD